MAVIKQTAIAKALGKLTLDAQREVLPLVEAVLIDAMISYASEKHPTDAHKAGGSECMARSIEAVRGLIINMAQTPAAPHKSVIYAPPPQ